MSLSSSLDIDGWPDQRRRKTCREGRAFDCTVTVTIETAFTRPPYNVLGSSKGDVACFPHSNVITQKKEAT